MNHHLRPTSNVCKVLLSSPTKIQGNYSQDNLLIEPVTPNMMGIHSIQNNRFDQLSNNVLLSRYHYMLVFNVPPENEESVIIPSYSSFGNYISIHYLFSTEKDLTIMG